MEKKATKWQLKITMNVQVSSPSLRFTRIETHGAMHVMKCEDRRLFHDGVGLDGPTLRLTMTKIYSISPLEKDLNQIENMRKIIAFRFQRRMI